MTLIRRISLAFGVAICLLQAGRSLLWWRRPQSLPEWLFVVDAYLVGMMMFAGVVVARRQEDTGRLILAAGWGLAVGILFRSFVGQWGDPSRHGGHEIVVLVCKGTLLALSVVGLGVTTLRKTGSHG